jgi:hypothetical protein
MTESLSDLPCYRPSGKIGARAFAVVLLAGFPGALLFGRLYAWGHAHAQGWVAASICTFIFCIAATVLVSILLKQSHSRSRRFNQVIAFILVLLMLSVRWYFALSAQLGEGEALVESIDFSSLSWHRVWPGSWTAFWLLVEAFVLFLLPVFIGKEAASDPYSEVAHTWAEKSFSGELFAAGSASDTVIQVLKQEGVTALLAMPRVMDLAESSFGAKWWTLKVTGSQVEADPQARWLNVAVVTHDRGADSKVTTSSTTLVQSWHLQTADYQALAHHVVTVPTAAPEVVATSLATPPELQPAVAALKSEQFAMAIELASAFCQHPSAAVTADAHRVCALAQARLEQWNNSFDSYHYLFELEPTAFNALQLATTAVMNSQLSLGQAWFDRAVEINRTTQEMPPARMQTALLSALEQAGEFAAARPHLDWLATAYRSIKTTDDHLVWTRGLPFFGEFLRKSLPILTACNTAAEIRAWYVALLPDLDEEGKAAVSQHLTSLDQQT